MEEDAVQVLRFMSNGLIANPNKTAMLFLNHKTDTQICLKIGDATITQVQTSKIAWHYLQWQIELEWSDLWNWWSGQLSKPKNLLNQEVKNEALIKVADSLFMSKVRYGLQLLGKVRITDSDPVNNVCDHYLYKSISLRILSNKHIYILHLYSYMSPNSPYETICKHFF